MVRFEVCVESAAGVLAAEAAGADRVELCSALSEGGLTPSVGLVEAVRAASTIPVNVLIRPRGGDFVYDRHEIRAMCRDIEAVAGMGVPGVVVGALTEDGDVDVAVCRELLSAAAGLSVTFHRAFDAAHRPFDAMEAVIDLGADRLLTSGQESSALEGAALIARLVSAAADRLIVMPGAGITEQNVARVLGQTGASEVHFSARTAVASPARYGNPRVALGSDDTTRRQASRSSIEAIISAARAVPLRAGALVNQG